MKKENLKKTEIHISAIFDEDEEDFVFYDTFHITGEANVLSGLIKKCCEDNPTLLAILKNAINRIEGKASVDIDSVLKKEKAKEQTENLGGILSKMKKRKDISDMSQDEIDEFIRSRDGFLRGDDDSEG